MDRIEGKVAEDAGLNRLRDLINSPIDDACRKNKAEERDAWNPLDMQKGEEEGGCQNSSNAGPESFP